MKGNDEFSSPASYHPVLHPASLSFVFNKPIHNLLSYSNLYTQPDSGSFDGCFGLHLRTLL